jgi:hypothetical protein
MEDKSGELTIPVFVGKQVPFTWHGGIGLVVMFCAWEAVVLRIGVILGAIPVTVDGAEVVGGGRTTPSLVTSN